MDLKELQKQLDYEKRIHGVLTNRRRELLEKKNHLYRMAASIGQEYKDRSLSGRIGGLTIRINNTTKRIAQITKRIEDLPEMIKLRETLDAQPRISDKIIPD
jgi:hypothetical protein